MELIWCAIIVTLLGGAWYLVSIRGYQARELVASLLLDYAPVFSGNTAIAAPGGVVVDHTPRVWAWAVGSLLCVCARLITPGVSSGQILVAGCVGALAGELWRRRDLAARVRHRQKMIEFYLPAVMERIVMGVGAGLDIVPSIDEAIRGSADPVSELLRRVLELANRGTSVDSALDMVASAEKSIGIRHAFIHLGLAHRQGGELIRPLKELSDATQVAYQESVEEAIAKLPAQAVAPLVLTFAGLIICFLTVPLLQVGSIAHKVAHVARP